MESKEDVTVFGNIRNELAEMQACQADDSGHCSEADWLATYQQSLFQNTLAVHVNKASDDSCEFQSRLECCGHLSSVLLPLHFFQHAAWEMCVRPSQRVCVSVCLCGRDKCICFGDCSCLKTPEPYDQTTLHQGLCCYRKVYFCVFVHAIVCMYMFAGNSTLVPEVKGATAVLLATFYRAVLWGADRNNSWQVKLHSGQSHLCLIKCFTAKVIIKHRGEWMKFENYG